MRKLKKSTAVILIASFVAAAGVTAGAKAFVDVFVNNVKLETEVKPYIENERTMVPAAVYCEKMGWYVIWDQEENTACIYSGRYEAEITLGSNVMKVIDYNDYTEKEYELDVPAYAEEDRLMIPVRALSEAFGVEVQWDSVNECVNLYYDENEYDLTEEECGVDDIAVGLNIDDDDYTGFEDYDFSNGEYDDFAATSENTEVER